MKRAIIVGTGTVVGVVAAVTYQPQSVLAGMGGAATEAPTAVVDTTGNADDASTATDVTTSAAATPTSEPTPSTTASAAKADASKGSTSTSSTAAKPSAAASRAATPAPTKATTTTTQTVRGSAVDVYYVEHGRSRYSGQVQVEVTVNKDVVTVINWVAYPGGEHLKYSELAYQTSSLPLEGLTLSQVKNAQIDTRSGATATSEAFVKSLQTALAKL